MAQFKGARLFTPVYRLSLDFVDGQQQATTWL
jgi:hypothetical protein